VATVAVTSVALDVATLPLAVGGTQTLVATVGPTSATNKTVTWSSSATSVATVSAAGLVTAIGPGNATITATSAADGSKKATCSVTVASTTVAWAKIDDLISNSPAAVFNDVVVASSGNVYAVGAINSAGVLNWGNVTATGLHSNDPTPLIVKFDSSGTAVWAKTVTSATAKAVFSSVALDSSENLYVAGYQYGTTAVTYGTVTLTGTTATLNYNAIVVSYNKDGDVRWGDIAGGPTTKDGSQFRGIAVDANNRVTVCGDQYKGVKHTYGTVDVTGSSSTGYNAVVVPYNDQGVVQWAKTLTSGGSSNSFNSVAADSSGNLYCVGYVTGNTPYNFGVGAITGSASSAKNLVMVKYDSSGTNLWAKTVSTGNGETVFNSVAVDSSGNAYAAGYQTGAVKYTYGTVELTGSSSQTNSVLVKYDSTGAVSWGKTIVSGTLYTAFLGVAVDNSGTIYTVGYQKGTEAYGYGNSVTATGPGSTSYNNGVIVQWNSSGLAQWARTSASTSIAIASTFSAVAADGSGNPISAGYQAGSASGSLAWGGFILYGPNTGNNPFLVKWKP